MVDYFLKILEWSEVWALLIPLVILLFRRQQPATLKPVIIYLWIAFILNLSIDIITAINIYHHNFDLSNNTLYNIHSVVRFVCFSLYFIQLPQTSFVKFKKLLTVVFLIFVVINFGYKNTENNKCNIMNIPYVDRKIQVYINHWKVKQEHKKIYDYINT